MLVIDQIAFINQLCQHDSTVAAAFTLAQAFEHLLRKLEGEPRLEQWKGAVRASGITELIGFVDGLADDAEALVSGCSESWSNGMVERLFLRLAPRGVAGVKSRQSSQVRQYPFNTPSVGHKITSLASSSSIFTHQLLIDRTLASTFPFWGHYIIRG